MASLYALPARCAALVAVALVSTLVACGEAEVAEEPATEGEGAAAVEEAPPTKPAEEAPKAAASSLPEGANPALTNPALASEQAPETFDVKFDTTEGDFTVRFHREWAPNGVDRLYNLVKIGYFDDVAFFRAVDNFMVQFGISGHPEVNAAWREATIQDDPVVKSNTKGMVTFAKTGAPNSRSTQLYINYGDNSKLDKMGFAPIGEVVEGMDVVESLYTGYGDGPPMGRGPNQGLIQSKGNAYLKEKFPELDYIESAEIVSGT